MESELDPWSLFIYAMKAPMTRDKYQTRVAKFFDFAGIPGTTVEITSVNEKCFPIHPTLSSTEDIIFSIVGKYFE